MAVKIRDDLSKSYLVEYDESASIGKRYRRQDEIGTPFCVTVDLKVSKTKKSDGSSSRQDDPRPDIRRSNQAYLDKTS